MFRERRHGARIDLLGRTCMFALRCTSFFRTWRNNPWISGVEAAVGASNQAPPRIVTSSGRAGKFFLPLAGSATAPIHIDRPWRGVLPCARPSSRCPSRENREGGANPPRWRHCKRETEPKPTVGTPMGRAWLNPPASQETCLDDQVTTLRTREITRCPGTCPVLRVMPPAE